MVSGPRSFWNEARESSAARLGDAIAFWAVAAFGIFLLFASTWIPAAQKLEVLRREERRIRFEIRGLEEENGRLACRLNAMYCDPYYLELILRREHGFLQEGERTLDGVPRKLEEGKGIPRRK
ncbi:MAG: hypothetical protein ACYS47_00665 [Planctomycetota bacterium]|jgi:hypothetical protein